MKANSGPKLIEHPHDAAAIADLLERMLEQAQFGPSGKDPLRSALLHIAARFAEIVGERINAAPDLHRQTFTGLLGVPPRQPEAARVHLVFKPSPGPAGVPVVPMHTRVATGSSPGGGTPVVFETQNDLSLVRIEGVCAIYVGEGHERMADARAILSTAGRLNDPMSEASVPVVRALYIAHDAAFGLAGLQQLVLHVEVVRPGSVLSGMVLDWGLTTTDGFLPLRVVSDATQGLSVSGAIVLTAPPAWPRSVVAGRESRWLTTRLRRVEAIAAEDAPLAADYRAPRVGCITIDAIAATATAAIPAAFYDGMPLDTSKDFFPLGERPRFGSVFQLLSPAFSETGTRIEFTIAMTNPTDATRSPIPTVSREGQPELVWEISTIGGYRSLAASDGTRSLTQDGIVSFSVPDDVAAVHVGSQQFPCVRARLTSGRYARIVATPAPEVATPPVLRSIQLRGFLKREHLLPEKLLSQGSLILRCIEPAASFDLFPAADQAGAALYIAVIGPDLLQAGARQLTLHVRPAPPRMPILLTDPELGPVVGSPRWQWRGIDHWEDLVTEDGSEGLRRSGVVKISIPDMTARWSDGVLDPSRLWLRIVWPPGTDMASALPSGLAFNAVEARHMQCLHNEVSGSSTGRPAQTFHALRVPILGAVDLQVREGETTWVSWREVDDLSGAEPADREFTLDRLSGTLRFGDGRHGRIPPPGASNIRLHRYFTGGGRDGNVPALALTQLRSTVPGVDSVTNVEPASGGLDSEPGYWTGPQASAWLRHRDRAVCAQDYADLALRSSPEIARAYCFGGRDLSVAATATPPDPMAGAGMVSVMVLANGDGPRPQPSRSQLEIVKVYLNARRPPMAHLVVMGPIYASVSVSAALTTQSDVSPRAVAAECAVRIEAFLHPLTGGAEGGGWSLSQRPHRSDLYRLLGAVDGVDVVRTLRLRIDAPAQGPFVIAAGAIEVTPDE